MQLGQLNLSLQVFTACLTSQDALKVALGQTLMQPLAYSPCMKHAAQTDTARQIQGHKEKRRVRGVRSDGIRAEDTLSCL